MGGYGSGRQTALSVQCSACHRAVVLSVDDHDGEVPVPALGPQMVCTGCGVIGAHTRPNWTERVASRAPSTAADRAPDGPSAPAETVWRDAGHPAGSR